MTMIKISKIYPQDELRRRRDIYTRVWRLENIGRPALHVWRESNVTCTANEMIADPEALLKYELSGLEARCRDRSDCPPFLYPYAGVGVLPSAFGCEILMRENQDPMVVPLLEKPEDVYKLKKPRPDAGQMKIVLDQLKCFQQANQGYYDVRMHDLQGPFSVASLIWGYEDFLMAVYTHPKEAHHLLGLATEFIIDSVEAQREVIENLILCHCVPDWIPGGFGIAVSDDVAAVVSPKVYEEFAVPYNNILSQRFGGVYIHSCGDSSPSFDSVVKHRDFRGMNFEAGDVHYPMAVEKLGGRGLIAPHPGLRFKLRYGDALGYVRFIKANTPPSVPCVITLYAKITDPSTLQPVPDPSLDEAIDLMFDF
jgi:uroporphyrinogen-III decarboxylase